jgi:hypothetical protein
VRRNEPISFPDREILRLQFVVPLRFNAGRSAAVLPYRGSATRAQAVHPHPYEHAHARNGQHN